MTLSVREFILKWSRSALRERQGAQEHFIDVCRILGLATPAEADPKGEWFTFERASHGPKKRGWADVWRKGCFIWEYKGKHRDLAEAYTQLLRYKDSLDNPPLLIVSDMEKFEIHTNFTGTTKQIHRFSLEELGDPETLALLRRAFEKPELLRPTVTIEKVTEEAADRIGAIAERLRHRGVAPQRAAHFLMKLVFCLFAQDIHLLPNKIFTQVLTKCRHRPEWFSKYLRDLFRAMETGGTVLMEDILHFNGGLFAEDDVVDLEEDELEVLLWASTQDWSAVEPSIFGTLFERKLDPEKIVGEHYTHPRDILELVDPVLMAPLRAEWDAVQARARALARKGEMKKARGVLAGFHDRLVHTKVLDPACGSGNFLYLALSRMKDLEQELWIVWLELLGSPPLLLVSPEQLYGLELSEYAHELASAVVWIGYLQWHFLKGQPIRDVPVLRKLTNIRRADALITRASGKAAETAWPPADVIIGNPPFLGGKRMRKKLTDAYVDELFRVYEGRVRREADLVCYWFEKARAAIAAGKSRRAGLIATNSIRGGANRESLVRIKQSGDIFFAWSDRPWILEGAAVRISMVGFDDGAQHARALDGKRVSVIHADLTSGVDVTHAARLAENLDLAFMGDSKGGKFEITDKVARGWLKLRNPNGRSNADVVRRWSNGSHILKRPRDMWIVDFGVDTSESDAAMYEAPFEHVRKVVKPRRVAADSRSTIGAWWLHERPRPEMRAKLRGLKRFLATTRHARHFIFCWMAAHILPDSALIVFAREDDYFFGVLQSRAHRIWALRTGTAVGKGNDPRYTPTTTFETFPMPHPSSVQRAEIASAARKLDAARSKALAGDPALQLTKLYAKAPRWLELLHEDLDRAVFAAYGWDADLSDEDILLRLLALNSHRAGVSAVPALLDGVAGEVLSPLQQEVWDFVKDRRSPFTAAQVADRTGRSRSSADSALKALLRRGWIELEPGRRGRYRVAKGGEASS